jgi:hypothetical protein
MKTPLFVKELMINQRPFLFGFTFVLPLFLMGLFGSSSRFDPNKTHKTVHSKALLPTLNGKVLFVLPQGSSLCCSQDPVTVPVPILKVTIKDINANTSVNVFTNAAGQYTWTSSTTSPLQITPSKLNDATNAILTTFDLVVIRKHFLKIQRLMCPFSRVAADATGNGVIDTLDHIELQQWILNVDTFLPVPKWRFFPRAYVKKLNANGTNPNLMNNNLFSKNVYNIDWNPYPFNAVYKYSTTESYAYNTGTTWMDKLNRWPFNSSTVASDTAWSFYCVRTGNVTGETPVFHPAGPSMYFTGVQQLMSNKKYKMVIKGHTNGNIVGYQFALRLNPSVMQVMQNQPSSILTGLSDANFNTGQSSEGVIKTLWVSPTLKTGDFYDGIELSSIEIKTLPFLDVIDPAAFIYFDENAMPTEFDTIDGVSSDYKIEVEIIEI